MRAPLPSSPASPPAPPVSWQVEILFLLLAGLLLGSLLATYVSGQRVIRMNRSVAEHHARILAARTVLSDVQDAETGQRGYLLTEDDSYLQPYDRAVNGLRADQLRIPGSSRLRSLIDRKLEELQKTIYLEQNGEHSVAVAIVRSNSGKGLMDEIRGLIAQHVGDEEQALEDTQQAADQATRQRDFIFGGVALANLIFLPWIYRRMKAEIAARLAAQREGQRQRELLAVTLTSIGDAVIVTDPEARVTFMNKVAEELTGWPVGEAKGRPCAEIFRIINEESRLTTESPVEKVLREGLIVGLANHTLLLRRDGSEVPIDDSGAPIRDSEGTCLGVVLVFRDFSEHKTAERVLKEAKAEVEAASRAKDRFLAALSHELRTPLTPVLALLSEWERGGVPENLRADVRMLRRNVEFEARLIDDLLDLTRISKGKLRLRRERVDLLDVVRATVTIMEEEIERKGLGLELALPAECPPVEGDATRLQQVLLNLLQNATKFTLTGHISVTVQTAPAGRVSVSVADTGIGMPPEMLRKIFVFFEQGGEQITRNFGGLGLGLALAHAIVEAHDGTLEARSEGAGHGSAFTVTLPAAVPSTNGAPATAPGQAPRNPGALAPLRILLVEDHADTLKILQRLLQRAGHEVHGVGSVEAAKPLLAQAGFDVLISDLGLPDGTGHDLLRAVRPHFAKPAIALSGYGLDDDVQRAREAGFNAHLTKPVHFESLAVIVARLASGTEEWVGNEDVGLDAAGEASLTS